MNKVNIAYLEHLIERLGVVDGEMYPRDGADSKLWTIVREVVNGMGIVKEGMKKTDKIIDLLTREE